MSRELRGLPHSTHHLPVVFTAVGACLIEWITIFLGLSPKQPLHPCSLISMFPVCETPLFPQVSTHMDFIKKVVGGGGQPHPYNRGADHPTQLWARPGQARGQQDYQYETSPGEEMPGMGLDGQGGGGRRPLLVLPRRRLANRVMRRRGIFGWAFTQKDDK